MARVPFAPLDNPRLQHLASAKNRQNGLSTQRSVLGGKSSISSLKSVSSPNKRVFEQSNFDDFDGENVDPAIFNSPSKKSKSDVFDKPFKPFNFSLTPAKSMPPPSTIPSRLVTPARANTSSIRAPLSAPAGRSPKRKIAGISKSRRTSAPFTRIDPPFASRGSSTLPFSLDAALSGTFSSTKDAGATIQESMPKNWFFEIYEDTPEEEAANLMEHSTLTLDLSSDDEEGAKKKDDRGKENTPPADYDVPRRAQKEIVRRKVEVDEMDDGQRSPLSDLETEPFAEAEEEVEAVVEKAIDGAVETEVAEDVKAEVVVNADVVSAPAVESQTEIVVWEDGTAEENVAPVA